MSILYNYGARVMAASAPDSVTALVDHGFRSWAMRQFRLAGVSVLDPRSITRGVARDAARTKIEEQRRVLASIILPEGAGSSILLCPEKPSFSGQFCARIFMPISGKSNHYCIRVADSVMLDICAVMRDVCSGVLAVELANSFIKEVSPVGFTR